MTKIHTTNYFNTLILPAEDCKNKSSVIPILKNDKPSIAHIQYDLIAKHPEEYTSDDVLFQVYSIRQDLVMDEQLEARKAYFSKGQACLRASPLTKTYGWAIWHNKEGKIQLVDVESQKFLSLLQDDQIIKIYAMRCKKA